MFFRLKKSGERGYVQIVENKRDGAAVRQRVIANVGRADELAASGALASLIASGAKLTDQVLLINALDEDAEGALSVTAKRIGGPMLFGRIWERLGVADVLTHLLKERAFEFPVERAVFVAALHRLFVSGSDRDCSSWMEDYDIPGAEGLDLHHFYHLLRRRDLPGGPIFYSLSGLASGKSLISFVRSVPIRLTQTPTRYRTPHRTEARAPASKFWFRTD